MKIANIKTYEAEMKHIIAFVTLVALLLPYQFVVAKDSQEKDIRELLSGTVSLLAARDIDSWAKCWVQDESFTIINFGRLTQGFKNYRKSIERFLMSASLEQQKHSDIHVYISGDVDWAVFRDEWTAKYTDGRSDLIYHGIDTVGFVKRNGRWLIQRFHATRSQ